MKVEIPISMNETALCKSTGIQPRRPQEISALTGLRIVGAGWVVLFHFQDTIYQAWPNFKIFQPVLSQGYFGVPLFFILSGYIIWHNYGSKTILDFRASIEFLWRRFARLWPVNIITQLLAIPPIWYTVNKFNNWGAPIPDWYSVGGWLKSAFMISLIGHPNAIYPWNQPAWTLDGEMIAYAIFPLLVAIILLLKLPEQRYRWIYAIIAVGLTFSSQQYIIPGLPYSWLICLLLYFVSGIFLCLVGRASQKTYPMLIGMQVVCPICIVLACYLGHTDFVGVLILGWIYSLSIDRGLGAKLFATPALKTAGYTSYSIYMLHTVVFNYGGILLIMYPIIHQNYLQAYSVTCLLVVCFISYLMWRYLESPARRKLNRIFKRLWP